MDIVLVEYLYGAVPSQSMGQALLGGVRNCMRGGNPLPLVGAGLVVGAAFGLRRAAKYARRSVYSALGWRPPSKLDISPANVTNHGSRAESRFAGSAEAAMSMTDGQVAVGHYGDDQFRISGSGWRMDVGPVECLVVPAHVWEEVVARTGDRVTLRGRTKDLDLLNSEVVKEEIYTDVFLIKLPDATFSKIGVSKPTIVPIERKVSAKVAGPVGMGTLGYLSLNEKAFGMTWYEGTTLPGYSGSPYTVSGKIAAMHLRGADVQHGPNIGVSAQLLYVTAKRVLNVALEDSEEWLIDQITKRKRRIYIDNSWGQLDSYRVRVGNQFAIVDKDTLNSSIGEAWDDYVDFIDFDPMGPSESAGSENSKRPGVLLSLAEPQGLEQSGPQPCIQIGLNDCLKALSLLPTDDLRKVIAESNRLYVSQLPESRVTNGQARKART